jgi:serine/threonine protein kinase
MEEIENEVRVIKKLCGPGTNTNIVEVLKIGELHGSGCYFIDMELCDITLLQYIYSVPPTPEYDRRSFPCFVRDAPSSLKATQIWNVMKHISNGVVFIHSMNEIHRDLKPSNSTLQFSLSLTNHQFFGPASIRRGRWLTLDLRRQERRVERKQVSIFEDPKDIAPQN